MPDFAYSAEPTLTVSASDDVVFGCLDDHRNLSAHVEQPSAAMLSSRMEFTRIRMERGPSARRSGLREAFSESLQSASRLCGSSSATGWISKQCLDLCRHCWPCSSATSCRKDLGHARSAGWFGGHYARWCARRMAGDAVRHLRTHTAAEPLMRGGTPRGEQE